MNKKLTAKELVEKDLIRPAITYFSAKVGRWQYRSEKGIYTTTHSKKDAVICANRILNEKNNSGRLNDDEMDVFLRMHGAGCDGVVQWATEGELSSQYTASQYYKRKTNTPEKFAKKVGDALDLAGVDFEIIQYCEVWDRNARNSYPHFQVTFRILNKDNRFAT